MNKFLVGLVLGIAIAAGLAVYLNNAPTQFIKKDVVAQGARSSSSLMHLQPGTTLHETNAAANTDNGDKADASGSYDFYDVLQQKRLVASQINTHAHHTASKPVASASKQVESAPVMVDVGSFSEQDQASDMRGKLALLGIDSTTHSENGMTHVLIGPFTNQAKAHKTIKQLLQQGVSGVIVASPQE